MSIQNRKTKRNTLSCGFAEDDLIAEALGETSQGVHQQVYSHITTCSICVQLLEQYRQLHSRLRAVPVSETALASARRALDSHLVLTKRPRLLLSVWDSPIGPLRIGRTDKGVALVEFVSPDDPKDTTAILRKRFSVEQSEGDGGNIPSLTHKLEAYLNGSRQALDWVIDDILMRSDFQRQVLQAASEIQYGTLTTYLGLAERISQPKAVRAVAQALRYNPVPIQIPCHRIIGSNGSLTGYAGNKIALKSDILTVEGMPVVQSRTGFAIAQDRLYVGREQDHIFCRPSCETSKRIRAGDRLFIASHTRAEEIGYAPCTICQPDLHSLHKEAEPSLF